MEARSSGNRSHRRTVIVAGIIVVLSINAFLIYRRITQRPAANNLEAEITHGQRADTANKDADAEALIAEWNKGTVTLLSSDALSESVAAITSDGCLSVTMQAPGLPASSLSPQQVTDLNLAIARLLKAYGKSNPGEITSYMRARGKTFDHRLLPVLKKSLSRRGQSNLDDLSDDALYARMWTAFQLDSHWNGFVAGSSCRQVWDGQSLTVDQIVNFDEDGATNPSSPAAVLYGLFRGSDVLRHHFAPTSGSIEEELRGEKPVLLADVKLIIQFDEQQYNAKAAYLCRFWFNRTAEKWQPIGMTGFASHPGTVSLPSLMF